MFLFFFKCLKLKQDRTLSQKINLKRQLLFAVKTKTKIHEHCHSAQTEITEN